MTSSQPHRRRSDRLRAAGSVPHATSDDASSTPAVGGPGVAGPRAAWPFLVAGASAVQLLGLVTGLAGPARSPGGPAWVAAAGLVVLLAVGVVLALRGRVSTTMARVVACSALASVCATGLVEVALGGVAALPWFSVLVLVVLAGPTLGDPRWVAGVAATVWGSALAVLGGVVPPASWPVPLGVLAAATGLAALLEAGRLQLVAQADRALAAYESARVTDPTTGLATRRGLSLVASRMVEAARRQGDAVHCLFLEIADVEDLGDRLGPRVVDDVLAAVAAVVNGSIRGTDLAARWDRLMLCVVGPGVGVSPFDLELRVREALTENPPVPPETWAPSVTAASASLAPWDAGNLGTLLALCEQEMYVRRVLRDHGVGSGPAAPPS